MPPAESKIQHKHILWVRWLLIIATTYLIYFNEPALTNLDRAAILFYISTNVVLMLLPERILATPWFYYVVVPVDTLFVAGSIYMAGAAATDFYLVFFLIIMIAAMGRSLTYIVIGGAAISLLYGWMMWRSGALVPLRLAFLVAVAVFIGYLVEQARQREAAVREQRHEVGRRMLLVLMHEVYNPLTTIRGNLTLLNRDPLPHPIAESLAEIERAAQRIEAVLKELKRIDDLSEPETISKRLDSV